MKLGLFIPPKIKAYTHIIQTSEERLQWIHGNSKKYWKRNSQKTNRLIK